MKQWTQNWLMLEQPVSRFGALYYVQRPIRLGQEEGKSAKEVVEHENLQSIQINR